MNPVILIPLGLGAAAVAQAALNRQIADRWGLAPAALLNLSTGLVCALALLAWCLAAGPRAGMLRVSIDAASIRVWWLLPGIFGFALVAGLPWAIGKVGALPTFVALVAAQMVASVAWDRVVDGIPLSLPRVAGAAMAVASVLLAGRR